MTQYTRALACAVLACAIVVQPAAAINLGHLLRSLSHKQIVRLQQGVERLARAGYVAGSRASGIPALSMADADIASMAPAVAASWDEATARRFGAALSTSARREGVNVVAIPTIAFGDNAFLNSRMLAATAHGVQSGNVIAALFPPTGGTTEERTLHERDWAPIEYAIEASGADAVTCRLRNGAVSALCGNRRKFAALLVRAARFKGIGIDTRSSALTSVDRIIRTMSREGLLHHAATRVSRRLRIAPPRTIAGSAVANGSVLLQNDANVLPLDTSLRSVVLVGGTNALAAAIRSKLPEAHVMTAAFDDPAALTQAQAADASILVLGSKPVPNERDFIRSVGVMNPRTIVLIDRQASATAIASLPLTAEWSSILAAVPQPTPPPAPTSTPPPARRGTSPPTPIPSPTPTPVPLVQHAPAALLTWGLGDAAPTEVVKLLFGDRSPSGHLPKAAGAFPFGAGLSYAAFEVQGLKISYGRSGTAPVTISFVTKNTGTRTAAVVEQLYLRYPRSHSPVLVAFKRLSLAPGKSKRVVMPLNVRSFAYWSSSFHAWFVAPGTYRAVVGQSAEQVQAEGDVHVTSK